MKAPFVAVIIVGGLVRPAIAQTQVECPPTLQVVQQGTGVEGAWSAMDLDEDGHHRLVAAGLFEGPPDQRRSLRPRSSEGQPNKGRVVQYFRWSEPSKDGVYLVCHYDGTTIVAHRRIEPTPRQCRLESIRGPKEIEQAIASCE